MEIMRTGDSWRRSCTLALLALVLGVAGLTGCAPMAGRPVVSNPAAVVPEAARAEATVGSEVAAVPATTEAVPEVAAAAEEGDVQPAEEVEPSPLDELPESAPELSPAELEKDKDLVAEALPEFDIPMVLNNQVVAYAEYFSNRHKELFSRSLERSGRYVERFRSIFEEAGLPKDLVYMAHVESAFKTNAYSRAKAKGIFQFIAATGRRYGLRIDSWVDERSDPEKSARAAAAYLKDLYAMFGDWYLALAAYNAGEGKIQRSLAQTRRNDFWSLASTRSLRAETKNYVPAILAATLIAKSPKKFGFDVTLAAPVATEIARIEGQTDLRILGRLANLEAEDLRQLNPQLRRGMTPPGTTTDVYVPAGLSEALEQAYANQPVADRLVLARHEVGKGESLGAIAHRYGVSASAIANANRLGKSSTVKPGQELIIPAVAPPTKGFDEQRAGAVAYRVRKGDTLSRIASRYRTTPGAIASASGIGIHASLRIGQRLVIPAKGTAAPTQVARSKAGPSTATSPVVHTVRRGETLYRIADHYQVTVDQICALNRIAPNGVLYPGTRLKIRTN